MTESLSPDDKAAVEAAEEIKRLRKEGQREKAIQYGTSWLDSHVPHPQVLRSLGAAYLSIHKLQKAEQCFADAVAADPRDVIARISLGKARLRRHNSEAAMEQFSAALAIDRDNVSARIGLGASKLQQGDFNGGKKDFDRVIEIDPHHTVAQLYLAVIDLKQGNIAAGVQRLSDLNRNTWCDPAMIMLSSLARCGVATDTYRELLASARETGSISPYKVPRRTIKPSIQQKENPIVSRTIIQHILGTAGHAFLAENPKSNSVMVDQVNLGR